MSHALRVYSALVLVALSVAGLLTNPPEAGAASCALAHATPGQASRTELARAVVCVSNAERRRHGLQELKINSRLSTAARRHSLDMVRRGYFAHTGPSGDTFVQRIRAAGYLDSAYQWLVGENLAWGWGASGSPGGILKAWLHSPEHRKILLRPSYREVGVGVALGGPRHVGAPEATFTADFGITN
ncbi:MAG: hypothetical protein QOE60_1718 [Thermoleophilaceae bacterium]|nr:hypothetical protein [Thermoleophilaceae bacterium]